jgi:hypothetical protein
LYISEENLTPDHTSNLWFAVEEEKTTKPVHPVTIQSFRRLRHGSGGAIPPQAAESFSLLLLCFDFAVKIPYRII